MSIILGSASPRRAEILHFFSLPFEQIPSEFDEESVPFQGDPKKYVEELSHQKAKALVAFHPDRTILTADTSVFLEGRIYNKPKDRNEAFTFLSELSGRWHSVFTSLTLHHRSQWFFAGEETRLLFNTLSSSQIDCYLDSIHFSDKAGGYAIQQAGSLIVKKIDGCYYNVMGLPINALQHLLSQIDLDLWSRMSLL